MFKKSGFIVLILIAIIVSSCSKHQKLLKSTDNELKYEKAVEYYESGDYYRALQVFEQLIPVYRGTNKAEKLYYYYAYAYFHEREYIMASYYFKRFSTNFPSSEFAEEAAFMTAYCKYLDSPRFSLDQSVSREAIDEFQLFINRYPFGEKANEANDLITELRDKLEMKSYNIASLYFKMEDYRAAIVSYQNLLKEYPDTQFKEEILYDVVTAYYNYAMKSIREKQKERFDNAIKAYFDFVALYPESEYVADVEKMKEKIQTEMRNSGIEEL